MKHELIKKLKNAGYPLTEYDESLPIKIGRQVACTYHRIENKDYIEPELSDLIVACGEDFQNLARVEDKKWFTNEWESGNWEHDTEGENPEEAVANLWLKNNENIHDK